MEATRLFSAIGNGILLLVLAILRIAFIPIALTILIALTPIVMFSLIVGNLVAERSKWSGFSFDVKCWFETFLDVFRRP